MGHWQQFQIEFTAKTEKDGILKDPPPEDAQKVALFVEAIINDHFQPSGMVDIIKKKYFAEYGDNLVVRARVKA